MSQARLLQPGLEPAYDGDRRADTIGSLSPAVALIGEQNVVYRYVPFLEVLHYLFSLHNRHIGVIRSVQDQGRCSDPVHLVDRRESTQKFDLCNRIAILNG